MYTYTHIIIRIKIGVLHSSQLKKTPFALLSCCSAIVSYLIGWARGFRLVGVPKIDGCGRPLCLARFVVVMRFGILNFGFHKFGEVYGLGKA